MTGYSPSGRVALQVLALPLQHSSSDFGRGGVVFARVLDFLQSPQRQTGIDKVRVVGNELVPLKVSWHTDWAVSKLIDGRIHFVGVSLHDTRKGVVCFLDLANHN
jgi:hypothetical protein